MTTLVRPTPGNPSIRTLPTVSAASSRFRLPATELLKAYAFVRSRILAAEDPTVSQQRQLLKLVKAAKDTRFGRDHRFADISSVADYQARVPLRTYGQHWDDYWKDPFPHLTDCTWPGTIPYFAVSSGTSSGKVKYIPCSAAMVKSNKRAALDILVHHIINRPHTRIFDGKCFLLGGSTDLKELAPGIRAGDISGIAAAEKPRWTQRFYFPPKSLTYITDWDEKIDRLAPLALGEDIRFVSGAPGWLAILFEKLASLRPETLGRIVDAFPHLEIMTHGGVSFAPYRRRFERLLEGSSAELREVYPASEGFVAIADRGPLMGLRMLTDNGLFYEFVPTSELGSANPTRHWLGNVEEGVDYAIALTTCAGLWSYLIGDVVRFVDRRPVRIQITGRTSYMLSAFGEHLTGELVETCVLAAAERIGAQVAEFAVGTEFAETGGALGRHAYVVEFDPGIADAERVTAFAQAVDRELASRNEDYEERRVIPTGVRMPVVHAVPPGTFARWLKSIGKYGGQNKVPRIIGDQTVLKGLLDFAQRQDAVASRAD
ncbi:MAG: GH3 auxin-responsive promoter family protein [Rhodospirillales bacterium]